MSTEVLAAVSAQPNLRALPGSNVLQQIVNGAAAWALVIALLGTFIGAASGRWRPTPITITTPPVGAWPPSSPGPRRSWSAPRPAW